MRSSVNDAAMYLHDSGLQSIAAGALPRTGAGGLALFLTILMIGLIKSGKANSKPGVLIALGMMIAASFAYAGNALGSITDSLKQMTTMVNDLGIGEATPFAIGASVGAVLWLFNLKPVWRIFWGCMGYLTWSAADGTILANIASIFDKLTHTFAG